MKFLLIAMTVVFLLAVIGAYRAHIGMVKALEDLQRPFREPWSGCCFLPDGTDEVCMQKAEYWRPIPPGQYILLCSYHARPLDRSVEDTSYLKRKQSGRPGRIG